MQSWIVPKAEATPGPFDIKSDPSIPNYAPLWTLAEATVKLWQMLLGAAYRRMSPHTIYLVLQYFLKGST